MKILLVEPSYKNKYPPLGLMKISAYHKAKGDEVTFVKGTNPKLKAEKWDRIYITTLFTFHWKKTIETIKYYKNSVEKPSDIFLGGIMATLLYDELKEESSLSGITINRGLLNRAGILGDDDVIVDTITPDYEIIDISQNKYLDYIYPIQNSYITSTTKGCIRRCSFCAVATLEPDYCDYIDIKEQIRVIDEKFGEKRNLMLMDNNILASKKLHDIVDDLVKLGFERGNKNYEQCYGTRKLHLKRYVDFNQGTDARLVTEPVMKELSRLEVSPLRIAFDHADEKSVKEYIAAQRLAAKYGIRTLSNYILFNFEDSPEDLYCRLKINIELNVEFAEKKIKTSIWSFPMKFMPITGEASKGRKYIGTKWNAKQLRGVQCILNATHGVVGPKKKFFEHAFGQTLDEYMRLIYMPEYFIFNRELCEENGTIDRWNALYLSLKAEQREEFIGLIKDNKFPQVEISDSKIKELYEMYRL